MKTTFKNNFFKAIFLFMCLALIIFSVVACEQSNNGSTDLKNNEDGQETTSDEGYLKDTLSWGNGVEFTVVNYSEGDLIEGSVYKFKTDNKFLIIEIEVYNGSSSVFTSDAADIWLMRDGTKIMQTSISERFQTGYANISQSATTTKTYKAIFEIGKDVSPSEFKLVISDGKLFSSKHVVIYLKKSK